MQCADPWSLVGPFGPAPLRVGPPWHHEGSPALRVLKHCFLRWMWWKRNCAIECKLTWLKLSLELDVLCRQWRKPVRHLTFRRRRFVWWRVTSYMTERSRRECDLWARWRVIECVVRVRFAYEKTGDGKLWVYKYGHADGTWMTDTPRQYRWWVATVRCEYIVITIIFLDLQVHMNSCSAACVLKHDWGQ